jgi:hypothetical protein
VSTFTRPARISETGIAQPVDLQYRRKENLGAIFQGTVTTSTSTTDFDVSFYSSVRFMVKVTSVSGTTPTLDVYVEGKYLQTGDYEPLLSRTGITSPGTYFLGQLDNLPFSVLRVRFVVGGVSPSFSVIVTAVGLV